MKRFGCETSLKSWVFPYNRSTRWPQKDTDIAKKVYRTEIVIGDMTLLSDSKTGNGHGNGSGSGQDRSGVRDKGGSGSSGSQGRYDDYTDGLGIDESEIPF
jgi:single-stranded DNA-binding protein